MEQNSVKISKCAYQTCINLRWNAYRVSIKADFADGNGYYRTWTVSVIANDEKDAKKIANGILDEYRTLCPESFNDNNGWVKFIDTIRAEFEADMKKKINN